MKNIILLIALICSFSGCIHEYPDDVISLPTHAKLQLHFVFTDNNQLEEYKTVHAKQTAQTPKARYAIELYKDKQKVKHKEILATAFNNQLLVEFDVALQTNYTAVAWVDWIVDENDFYEIGSLYSIGLEDNEYVSSTDQKDAFAGNLDLNLQVKDIEPSGIIHKTIPLARPLSKFKIISTDVKKYFETKTQVPYKVMLTYHQNLPYYYTTQNKVITNFLDEFTTTALIAPFPATNDTCTLFFDWIFSTDQEQQIPISFKIYDQNETLIIQSPIITVPLMRNKLTIISDQFFTSKFNDGMGIDDKFEGEIVIEL